MRAKPSKSALVACLSLSVCNVHDARATAAAADDGLTSDLARAERDSHPRSLLIAASWADDERVTRPRDRDIWWRKRPTEKQSASMSP